LLPSRIERTQQRINSLQLAHEADFYKGGGNGSAISCDPHPARLQLLWPSKMWQLLTPGHFKSVSVNRPSLRTFSLQTGIVFFGFTQPSEQHITDRMETRLNNDCRGIFCFAIADRKLDQLSWPPDTRR
jgi:hypothetical protein